MHDHLRRLVRALALVAALVLAAAFVFSWGGLLGFVMVMLGGPILMIVLAGLLLADGIEGVRQARRSTEPVADRAITVLAAPILAVVSAYAFLPLVWCGVWAGTLSRLAINVEAYRKIVASEATRPPSPAHGTYVEAGGTTYVVDRGPPVRVALEPDGFLDNWSGIVHDPTGRVMLADGFDARGRFRAPDDVTKLFGGDLVSCRPLFGDFYSCSFT